MPIYFSVLAGIPPLWLSIVIAAAPLVLRLWMERRLIARTPFDLAVLLFLAACGVGFLVTADKNMAMGALGSTLASILIYYGLTSNARAGNKYWTLVGVTICTISLLLTVWFFSEGTARYVSFNRWIFPLFSWVPKSTGPVLQFNSLGALLASVIPGLAAITLFKGSRVLRVGSGVLAALFLAALILSDSGGGWIAAACGLAFVLGCRAWKWGVAAAATGGVAGGAAALFYHRLSWLAPSFSTESLMTRFTMWEGTIKMFNGWKSVTGLGMGNWSNAYQSLYGVRHIHVHNSYLQLYVDGGLLGLGALGVAAVQFVRLSRDILISS